MVKDQLSTIWSAITGAKTHLYYDDLAPASKTSLVNHRQQRTAFETDTGRSVSAAGTGLPAPHRPFGTPIRISAGCKERVRLYRPNPLKPSCRSLRRPDLGESRSACWRIHAATRSPITHTCQIRIRAVNSGHDRCVRDLLASQAVTARGDSLRSCAALPTPAAAVG
jgi:hypothetical protein